MRTVAANGLRFAYLEEGAGPLVLLLHGFPDTARSMFTGPYTIEAMPGGHFLHREHPTAFAERLLAHL
jgi:pimeloyl-ACP methyl ester carboxylesterase